MNPLLFTLFCLPTKGICNPLYGDKGCFCSFKMSSLWRIDSYGVNSKGKKERRLFEIKEGGRKDYIIFNRKIE